MCQNRSEDSAIKINFECIPISAVRHPTICFLSQSLNTRKILSAENNCQRDWRGFAHLAGLNVSDIPLTEPDPMLKVLTEWKAYQTASFQELLSLLGEIDRWDVADDVIDILTEDARVYLFNTSRSGNLCNSKKLKDIIENLATEPVDYQSHNETAQQIILTEEELIRRDTSQIPEKNQKIIVKKTIHVPITRSDIDRAERNLPLQRYDAFLIFADADLPFAEELVNRMENHPKFKFVLCLKDRDILGGVSFEHDAVMGLIRERCNRLIVIVSNAFLVSSLNNFFVQYAAALQIEKGCRKVIPCLYENCELPEVLNCFSCLKYHQTGVLYDFWSRLSDSIRAGRLQYAMTMNALAGNNLFPFEEVKNEISESNTGNYIPMTEFATSNMENLDVRNREVGSSRARISKLKKWQKSLRRKLTRTCF